jgi:hypothetical protein
MRQLAFSGAAAAALILGGCATHGTGAGGPPWGDCTGQGHGSQPPFGPVSMNVVIEQHGADPNHLNLKPHTIEVWGGCVDGKSGDIHTFHKYTNQLNLAVSFDPSLSTQASWPVNANAAIGQSAAPNGPFSAWQTGTPYYTTTPAPGGQVVQWLNFTIQVPTPPGSKYYYQFNYVDAHGQTQPVEPSIQPH